MKKTIVLLSLIVLIAALLVAFTPPPSAIIVTLHGILHWNQTAACGYPDFVTNPVMDDYYLTGKGFPTWGQYDGCRIDARGFMSTRNGCYVFSVVESQISCPNNLEKLPLR